eukprot:1229214-Prorocentrum_lima.AAC.1
MDLCNVFEFPLEVCMGDGEAVSLPNGETVSPPAESTSFVIAPKARHGLPLSFADCNAIYVRP